eukprot:g36136.t1
MQALEKARNDNERMLLRERARQFPPPYAIGDEEKKSVVETTALSGRREEDQTSPGEVVRQLQGQDAALLASTERVVGAWNEMQTTITVGMDGAGLLPMAREMWRRLMEWKRGSSRTHRWTTGLQA